MQVIQRFIFFIGFGILLTCCNLYAMDNSAKAQAAFDKATDYAQQGEYTKALKYIKESYKLEPADGTAFNLGYAYEKLKDYPNAIKWYKQAFKMGNRGGAINLGLLYHTKLKDYPNAIIWYKKAFNAGDAVSGRNLALLYENTLKDNKNAIIWYKKAIAKGDIDSRKNLGLLYHELGDDLHSVAYMMGMIGHPYTKERALGFFRKTWKIDEPTLKKAYELQKKLVPDPYTGGIE